MPFRENSVLKMEKQFYEFIAPKSKYGSPTLPALCPKFLTLSTHLSSLSNFKLSFKNSDYNVYRYSIMYDNICSLWKIYKMMKPIIKIAIAFTLGNIVVFSSSLLYNLLLPKCHSSKLISPDLSGPKFCVCISAFQLVMMDGPTPT